MHIRMVETNNLSYEAWKEYLKNDKEMNKKWKSLTALGENVKDDLKESLESLPHSEALSRRKVLTAKNIFNIINTAKEKPNFRWKRKMIRNEIDERHEYVIQCINPSSDYIFRKIKEERGVASMFGDSIDKYLQPVADKIWALKSALRVSFETEVKPSNLSYESLRTDKKLEMPEGVENHYAGNDRDIVNENGDVVPNPKFEHIPAKTEPEEPDFINVEENGQLIIPFEIQH